MYRFEDARQKHIEQYKSFLFCVKTGAICSFMEEQWNTGLPCSRQPCILEDPEHIELEKKIAANRAKRKERKEEEPAPAKHRTKTSRNYLLEKIERLEKESEEAYRKNKPKTGERKLQEAMMLRRQLRGGK